MFSFNKISFLILILVLNSVQSLSQGSNKSCPGCDLRGKNFTGQNLTNANFEEALLDNANFTNAILDGVVFSNASLKNANFSNASLKKSAKGPSVFIDADLAFANFTNAKIDGAVFEYADLTAVSFVNTDLSTSVFGPSLTFTQNDSVPKPKFIRTKLSCEFPWYWTQLDVKHSVLPNCKNYSVKKTVKTDTLENGIHYSIKMTTISLVDSIFRPAKPYIVSAGDTVYVSPSGTDDNSCGNINSPCMTIGKGISQCPGGGCNVFVDYGTYALASSIVLREGVNVYGGLVKGQPSTYQSMVTAPADGTPAFTGTGINAKTIVDGFIINASDATTNGKASVGIQLTNSAGVNLAHSYINAGKGAPGQGGSDGVTGTKGNNGGNGASTGGGSGGTSSVNAYGGQGAQPATVSQNCKCSPWLCAVCDFDVSWTVYNGYSGGPGSTGKYAPGSNGADPVIYGCFETKRPSTPSAGTSGTDANTCGQGGSASTNTTGNFSNGSWSPVVSGNSTAGGAGGGGGGGGSGGPCAYCNCVCHGTGYTGTAGGGGGAGGQGGTVATGGQMGGASIGIVLVSSTITTGEKVYVTNNAGGTGGKGGNGGQGGAGGAGGSAQASNDVCNDTGGQGGAGGPGGYGAASGGAAGGNGGPSIGVVLSGTSTVAGNPVYYSGISGTPGVKGTGGTPAKTGICTGKDGTAGVSGTVSNTLSF